MTLTPAYGREPNSIAAVIASLKKPEDWRGLDRFNEAYTSLPEMVKAGMNGHHEIRYGKGGMKVAMMKIEGDVVTINGKAI